MPLTGPGYSSLDLSTKSVRPQRYDYINIELPNIAKHQSTQQPPLPKREQPLPKVGVTPPPVRPKSEALSLELNETMLNGEEESNAHGRTTSILIESYDIDIVPAQEDNMCTEQSIPEEVLYVNQQQLL